MGQALYDWEAMRESGYDWWMKRLEMSFAMFDVVRVDHFRAFRLIGQCLLKHPRQKRAAGKTARMDFFGKVFARFKEPRIICRGFGAD